MTLRRRWAALGAVLVTLATVGAVSLVSGSAARAAACQVAAAGDIAESGGRQADTARQIISLAPAAVLTLGDLAYDNGSTSDFAKWYTPSWGQSAIKSITHPAPGNHEYGYPEYSTTGADYFTYFGLDQATQSYYAFDLCGWRLYSLNSELTSSTSPTRASMLAWLAADVAAHPDQPKIGYWHKPRWSSGSSHGDGPEQSDLWAAAVAAGFKLVLNGHDHVYERFAPQNATGGTSGVTTREIIVGTGGAGLNTFGTVQPNSQKRVTGSHGVILLTLGSGTLTGRWADWDGSVSDTFTDTFTVPSSSSTPPATSTTTPPATSTTPPSSTTTPPSTTTPCAPTATATVTATVTATSTVTAPRTPFVATITGTVTPPA